MPLFWKPYKSDVTSFIEELKAKKPARGIGGAVAVRAEIHSAGRPSRLVLESDLAATAAPGAETRAEAWVLLTDLRAGDRLLLRVEPMDETGGSVYLSGLKLK